MLAPSDRKALRHWYREQLLPRLSRMSPNQNAQRTAVRRSYAYYIVAGTRIPHPRHYPNLAALAGVELPQKFAAVCVSLGGCVADREVASGSFRAYGLGEVATTEDGTIQVPQTIPPKPLGQGRLVPPIPPALRAAHLIPDR
jgi:hypothetical protein